jgi:cell division inhibitor SepF
VPRNSRDWLGPVEHDNDARANKDGYPSEDFHEAQNDNELPNGQLSMGNGIQIAIVRPRNFQDAITIGEYYRYGIPVVINLEDVDHSLATRIVDFVSGLVLGLCGDMERPSRRTFLIVPADAAILTAHDGLTKEGFFNQALRSVNDTTVLAEVPGEEPDRAVRLEPGQLLVPARVGVQRLLRRRECVE